jgi:AcrR family transcriptional regulator
MEEDREPDDGDRQAGGKRRYRMRERGRAVEQTRESILQAAFDLWVAQPYDEVTLEAVAAGAGMSRQTVHRQFGSKEDLLVAVIDWRRPREDEADARVAPGDVDAAVRHLVDRYEAMGDVIVRFLGLEGRLEAIDYFLANGRDAHRGWLEHVFAPFLPEDRRSRGEAVLTLYAATDVMVWKLLRRDFGRSRAQTEDTIRRLVVGALHTLATTGSEGRS